MSDSLSPEQMLEKLRVNGSLGWDLSPGDPVAEWAYLRIAELQDQLTDALRERDASIRSEELQSEQLRMANEMDANGMATSLCELAQQLRDWYDKEFIHGEGLSESHAQMLIHAARALTSPEPDSSLRAAAQALVDRWDTPLWKDVPHTGEYIHALRIALALPIPDFLRNQENLKSERAATEPRQSIPQELFDGHAVWLKAGNVKSEDVSRVLDAVVALIRSRVSGETETRKECGATFGVLKCSLPQGHAGTHTDVNNSIESWLQPETSVTHASDCATNNEPALPAGPCNCGASNG